MSVTSRILVVDMLQSDIPTDLITGILVLHAEKYILIPDSSMI
jgi:DNA excision repair protein ERCC-4